jgi:poly-gamma-glutamate capsule biosynthesis protein CapA/YwtB (metallophosphatase superfamily)
VSTRPRVVWSVLAAGLVACVSLLALPPSAARAEPGTVEGDDGATTIRFLFGGDVLMHSPLVRQAQRNFTGARGGGYDFRPMFSDVRALVRSVDLAVCHLETPVAPPGERLSTYPVFGVPREVTGALAWAGFDHCSAASNHVLDRGVAGIEATMDALADAGITQHGMARDAAGAEPLVRDVAGVPVALLSYTYGYNGFRPPAGQSWRSNLIDPERIRRDARLARERGAKVVIASVHWGIEASHVPSDEQRRIARTITAPGGVDLVVGHHAHVLQPIEQANGTWVLFGLSNLVSNLPTDARWPAASQDGALVEVSITVGPNGVTVARPVVHPTWVDKNAGWVVRLLTPRAATRSSADARASLERTRRVLNPFVVAPGSQP